MKYPIINSKVEFPEPTAKIIPLRLGEPIAAPQPELPSQAALYPELRYMGSKKRLLPWIHQVLDTLDFESALDPFAGSWVCRSQCSVDRDESATPQAIGLRLHDISRLNCDLTKDRGEHSDEGLGEHIQFLVSAAEQD